MSVNRHVERAAGRRHGEGKDGDAKAIHKAADDCERTIDQKPTKPAQHATRAGELYRQGRKADALKEFKRAFELDPGDIASLNNIGAIQCELGRHDDALESSRRALKLDPDSAGSHRVLSMVMRHLERHAEALDAINRAISLGDTDSSAHFDRGRTLYDLERFNEAADALGKAAALAPTDATVHRMRAQCLLELHHNSAAIRELYCRSKVRAAFQRRPAQVCHHVEPVPRVPEVP